MEVVVGDCRVNRNARDIDHMGPGHSQEEQQTQHTLLVVRRAGDPGHDIGVEAQARHDHHGTGREGIGEDPAVQRPQSLLKLSEPPLLFL